MLAEEVPAFGAPLTRGVFGRPQKHSAVQFTLELNTGRPFISNTHHGGPQMPTEIVLIAREGEDSQTGPSRSAKRPSHRFLRTLTIFASAHPFASPWTSAMMFLKW